MPHRQARHLNSEATFFRELSTIALAMQHRADMLMQTQLRRMLRAAKAWFARIAPPRLGMRNGPRGGRLPRGSLDRVK